MNAELTAAVEELETLLRTTPDVDDYLDFEAEWLPWFVAARLDEPRLVGEDDGLRAVVEIKFGEDACDIVGFVFASFVPALLLFLLWTLVTSIVLLRRTPSTQTRIAFEGTGPRRATSSTT